jgi:uncharacterized protein
VNLVAAAAAGALFALGLVISGMTDPAKVIGFLDVGGAWDPALAFVMGAALAVYAPVAWLAKQRRHPVFDTRFHLPQDSRIDRRLLAGAAIFGVGWGLSGYCPGPALVSVTSGTGALGFVAAMVLGMALARLLPAPRSPDTP